MLKRLLRHITHTPWQTRKQLDATTRNAIEAAVAESEQQHRGQICVAIEGALDFIPVWRGQSARERAIEVFSLLRVWDTAQNNGVLIYLLLADRDVEIIADRGINDNVSTDAWEQACRAMEAQLRIGNFTGGVVTGIREVGAHLAAHFPADATSPRRDELPDRPTIL